MSCHSLNNLRLIPTSRVEELMRRRAVIEQVNDRVNFDKVRSLFKMIYHRRRFVAHLEALQRERRKEMLGGMYLVVKVCTYILSLF